MSPNVTEMALPDGGQLSSTGKRATKRNHKDPAAAASIGPNLDSVNRSSSNKEKKNAKGISFSIMFVNFSKINFVYHYRA